MTAMTVPPPGWAPLGASDFKSTFRRNLRLGLTLSGATHVALLGVILWVEARNVTESPRWTATPIHVVATPTISEYRLLPSPPSERQVVAHRENPGPPLPVDFVLRPDLPKSGPIARGHVDPAVGSFTPRTVGEEVLSMGPDDPAESAMVAYDTAPVPTFRPEPLYPDWCREQRIEGRVVLHALVGRDGRVKRLNVVRPVQGLSEPARAAIARWVFRPATFGGKPVAVWVEIPVEFRL